MGKFIHRLFFFSALPLGKFSSQNGADSPGYQVGKETHAQDTLQHEPSHGLVPLNMSMYFLKSFEFTLILII